MAIVSIDAGHGGMDSGATYQGREEKEDTLRLAIAVGKILENNGITVSYTRTNDIYETPFKKAQDANASGADLFISLHRNSGTTPNTYNGVQGLVFRDGGIRTQLSKNINANLTALGFQDLGIEERPNLVVLRRTNMPAILLEIGFINSDKDNQIFDNRFNEIAQAIADGILDTLRENRIVASNEVTMTQVVPIPSIQNFDSNESEEIINQSNYVQEKSCPCQTKLYRVQVGAYRNKDSADRILNSLLVEGFPAFIIYDEELYKIQVGAFEFLANAIAMEERLRKARYNTYITT